MAGWLDACLGIRRRAGRGGDKGRGPAGGGAAGGSDHGPPPVGGAAGAGGAGGGDGGGGSAGDGFPLASFSVVYCASRALKLRPGTTVHALLGRSLYLSAKKGGEVPASVEEFRAAGPVCVRLDRGGDGLRQARPEDVTQAGEGHSDCLLFVRGVEESRAPGGHTLPTVQLVLEASTSEACAEWAAAVSALVTPWEELLSSGPAGGGGAGTVQAPLDRMRLHLPSGTDADPQTGAVSKLLGTRVRRGLLVAYDWLHPPANAVGAGASSTVGMAADAIDQAINLPVAGVALRLGLLVVQAGALAVLAEEHDAIRADVAGRALVLLGCLLDHTLRAVQLEQTDFNKPHVEQLCQLAVRLESVLADVEWSYFRGRVTGALSDGVMRGWGPDLDAMHKELLGLFTSGAVGHGMDEMRNDVSHIGHGMDEMRNDVSHIRQALDGPRAEKQDMASYDLCWRAPVLDDADYVAGVSNPHRAEHTIIMELERYVEEVAVKAPRLGVVAIGGSGKTTACAAVVASDYVREKFPLRPVWVQLNDASTIATITDAVVALVFHYRGEGAARQLLQLKPEDDVVSAAAGLVREVSAVDAARRLVVIDDVLDMQSQLLDKLLAVVHPATPVLISTRSEDVVSRVTAQPVKIETLPREDARMLLAKAVGKGAKAGGGSPFSPGDEAAWVNEVLYKTKLHALSLSIVAAMIKSSGRAWGPVLKALRSQWMQPGFGGSGREDEAQQRSVRATMDASLALLPDDRSRAAFKAVGVLPTSVRVGVCVLERLWRPYLEGAAAAGVQPTGGVGGADEVGVHAGVAQLVDRLVQSGLVNRVVDDALGEVVGIEVHPVVGEYARTLLGGECRATHLRLVRDYMAAVTDGGVDDQGWRRYPFCETPDDGYWYDNCARHAAACGDVAALLWLTEDAWKAERLRTGGVLAYQADVEIVLASLLVVANDPKHEVRRRPAQLSRVCSRLALMYRARIAGSRADNTEQAVTYATRACGLVSREQSPFRWASSQYVLGGTCRDRVGGDKGANVKEAVACYLRALEVWTREAAPREWAMTQNALGGVRLELMGGDKAANVKEAVACFLRALEVRTREAAPREWAMAQYNLGNARLKLVGGDRAANVKEAVACYLRALEVRTQEAAPQDWAYTSFNLFVALQHAERWGPALEVARALRLFGSQWVDWPQREAGVLSAIARLEAKLQ